MSKFLIGNIKGPKGDKGEQGATGPKGEQGIQGPVGPAGGVNSVNGMTGDVTVEQGVNLLTGTSKITVSSFGAVQVARTNDGVKCIYSINARGGIVVPISKIDNTSRQIYTVSFLYKSTLENKTPWFYFMQKENQFTISNVPIEISNDWKKYTAVLDFSSVNVDNPTSLLLCYLSADLEGQYIEIKDGTLKLEPGTVPNPVWTPAPQDVLLKGEVDGRNLFVMETSDEGYINQSGSLNSTSHYATTDYINVVPGDTFTLQNWREGDSAWVSPAWYDSSNTYLGGYVKNTTADYFVGVFTAPDNAAYVRFSAYKSLFNENGKEVKIQVERGSTATPWTPAPEDVVTKTPPDIFDALDSIPEMHRNLYGGRNLGESTQMSEAHKKAIQDGSFKDLWVGDYWTHDGINYRIADADYFWNCGNAVFTTHHLVIVPDTKLYDEKMNTNNTTENGYVGSEMRLTGLERAKATIKEAFPEMVLSHKDLLCNAVASGRPSGGGWVDSEIELMNEIMVYGCYVFTPKNDGTNIPYIYTTGNSQLALFRLNPKFIKTREDYWLRDVVSAAGFAAVNGGGYASYGYASLSLGVRPYFCIGVQPSGDEADDDMEVVTADSGRMDGREMDSTEDVDLRQEMDSGMADVETETESDVTKAGAEQEPDATEDAEREPDTTKEKMQEV